MLLTLKKGTPHPPGTQRVKPDALTDELVKKVMQILTPSHIPLWLCFDTYFGPTKITATL